MIHNPQKIANDGLVRPTVKDQIQQNGIDLTIKDVTRLYGHAEVRVDTKRLPGATKTNTTETLDKHKQWRLEAGNAYIANLNETVKIPKDMCALIVMRSTFNRCGCLIMGCVFDSGYEGKPSLSIYPHVDIFIEENTRIAQILFFDAESAKLYDGQYQHQGIKEETAPEKPKKEGR